ncbi:MAG: choice-of-anchor I family protein [Campylobacteraceae bacterium]|jgi:hypothetical protein|nr:choice-of-anchor I family protein [Campylobacteraceae bacterium]
MFYFKQTAAVLPFLVVLASCSSDSSSASSVLANVQKGYNGHLSYIGSYSTGEHNEDGGVAEIVAYNKDNKKIYMVNGAVGSIDIVSVDMLRSDSFSNLTLYKRVDIQKMAEDNGFSYSDVTSVDVYNGTVALAVQAEVYSDNGYIVLLDDEGEYVTSYNAGVQPDMICFTKDGRYILSANEGEPREGYGAIDPKGSVTIVDLELNITTTVDFTDFDTQKSDLIDRGVIFTKDALPSTDLEPEYITVDGNKAYVSLQEANAIATLDIALGVFTDIRGLGFKDHNEEANKLDVVKNDEINITTQNLYGVYMPDGISFFEANGAGYILTANEGDGRDWEGYKDVTSIEIDGKKVDTLDVSKKEGLDAAKNYLLGARSFSIYSALDMTQVYDSGSDFEEFIAQHYPAFFNASHTNNDLDSRSGKKGPEPEYITSINIEDKTYALIGLERFGGVMMYDITTPADAKFYDYINTRDFNGTEISDMGDLGVEGLCAVDGADSPTGKPILFTANEVSGTIAVFEIR